MRRHKETRSHKVTESMHMNSEAEAACKEPACVYITWGPRVNRRSECMSTSFIQNMSPFDNYLQTKIKFSPRESHLGNKLLLRHILSPAEDDQQKQTQRHLWNFFVQNVKAFFFFFLLQVICIYIMALALCFYGIPVCSNVYISLHVLFMPFH